MKYINVILLLIIVQTAYAQNYPVLRTVSVSQVQNEDFDILSGDYIKDTQNHFAQYIGTWQYSQDGIIFTLKLVKVSQVRRVHLNGSYEYYDKIISTYKLVKNGITLIDNLSTPSTDYTGETNTERPKFGTFKNLETFDYLNGGITDLTNNILISRCEITRLPGSPAKIFFKLYANHSWKRNPPEFYEGMTSMYSMPNNIEMVKID